MKPFEFYFDTAAVDNLNNEVTAGIRKLSGDPVEIGKTLGLYADKALKQLNQDQAMKIILHAYHQFKKLNPGMTEELESQIVKENISLRKN